MIFFKLYNHVISSRTLKDHPFLTRSILMFLTPNFNASLWLGNHTSICLPFMAPPTSSALNIVLGNPFILNELPSFITFLSKALVPHFAFLPDAVIPYHGAEGSGAQHVLHEQEAVALNTSAFKLLTNDKLAKNIIITTRKTLITFISNPFPKLFVTKIQPWKIKM